MDQSTKFHNLSIMSNSITPLPNERCWEQCMCYVEFALFVEKQVCFLIDHMAFQVYSICKP
jgi:hypothetical protein